MHDEKAELIACIPRLRRYARALKGERACADDLVQDTLERGWHRLGTWRRGSDMRAWLFGIMHNLHVDHLRKSRVQSMELDDQIPDAALHTNPTQGLEMQDMQTALQRLPAEQREVLLLVVLEEMTYEEVAVTLSIPLGTVMSRLSRAREKLRAMMEGRVMTSSLKVVK